MRWMSFTASLACVDGWTPPTSPAPVSRPALLTAPGQHRPASRGTVSQPPGTGRQVWRPPPLCNRTFKLKLDPPPITLVLRSSGGDRQDHRPSLTSAGPTNDPRQMSFSGHWAMFHRRGTLHVGWGELPYDHRRIFAEVKRRPLYVV